MWIEIFSLVLGSAVFIYVYVTRRYGSFKILGIAEEEARFPFGSESFRDLLSKKRHFVDAFDRVYDDFRDSKFVIVWHFAKPVIVIRDPELAKLVLVKDFEFFTDRRHFDILSEDANPYFVHLLTNLSGEKWKRVRNIIAAIFADDKLKVLTPLINKVADNFVRYIQDKSRGNMMDVKAQTIKFTAESIASCAFGFEAQCFPNDDNDSEFLKMAQNVDEMTKARLLKLIVFTVSPKLFRILRLSFLDKKFVNYFHNIVHTSLKHRRSRHKKDRSLRRNDMIDLFLDGTETVTTNNGKLLTRLESGIRDRKIVRDAIPDFELERILVSNGFLMFITGFETCSTIMAAAIHFLALHFTVQEKVYDEVKYVMDSTGQDDFLLNYEQISAMTYLDKVIYETLRLFPLEQLNRECINDYIMPGPSFMIKKGMEVTIPIKSIMNDPKFFIQPDKFDPEHFSDDQYSQRSHYAFMAFGHGPRNCVGMKFALLQLKIGIARLIYHFKILPCSKTPTNIVINPQIKTPTPIGRFWAKFSSRKP